MKAVTDRWTLVAICALVAGAGGACASSGGPFQAPPPDLREMEIERGRIASRLRVIGTVRDPNGKPVPGASVHVEAHPRARCVGGRGAVGSAVVRDDGWFIKTLYFYSLPSTPSCVTVRVRPPEGSTLQPDSVSDLLSEFRHGAVIDTVIVRLALRRGGGVSSR